MMPLWLKTLGERFYDGKRGGVKLPWQPMAITLALFIVPIVLGMIFAWKKQHLVERMRVWIKRTTLGLLAYIIIFATSVNWYIWLLMTWRTVVAGMLMTCGGYVGGFAIAKLFKQTPKDARTIAVETGVQNGGWL